MAAVWWDILLVPITIENSSGASESFWTGVRGRKLFRGLVVYLVSPFPENCMSRGRGIHSGAGEGEGGERWVGERGYGDSSKRQYQIETK